MSSDRFNDTGWIPSIIPHRYPLLLVDRVVELEPDKRIRAIKNVTYNEPFFEGHFPGHPIMPGVLVIEALAQTGGILLLHDVEGREGMQVFLASVDKARFRRPIVPGDQVELEVVIQRRRASFCRFEGRAVVDGELATEAICTTSMIERS